MAERVSWAVVVVRLETMPGHDQLLLRITIEVDGSGIRLTGPLAVRPDAVGDAVKSIVSELGIELLRGRQGQQQGSSGAP